MSDTHNERNKTIGLGVFDQLDLLVTESMIRKVSCTHISHSGTICMATFGPRALSFYFLFL